MGPNRVALVTGGSRGLGAQISQRLAVDGWAVAVNYRSGQAAAETVVESIREAGGVAEAFGADVVDEAAVPALVAEVERRLGPLVAVVANATGPQPEAGLEELTWRAHLDQLEFFVKSPTLLVQAALPGMRMHGGGRVILIGSDVVTGPAAHVRLRRGEARQVGLTKVWAKALGPDNITVNLVQPGWIPVERHAGVDTSAYAAEVPLGRLGTPEDVAAMVAFLASGAASFVTGQQITVNGGHVL